MAEDVTETPNVFAGIGKKQGFDGAEGKIVAEPLSKTGHSEAYKKLFKNKRSGRNDSPVSQVTTPKQEDGETRKQDNFPVLEGLGFKIDSRVGGLDHKKYRNARSGEPSDVNFTGDEIVINRGEKGVSELISAQYEGGRQVRHTLVSPNTVIDTQYRDGEVERELSYGLDGLVVNGVSLSPDMSIYYASLGEVQARINEIVTEVNKLVDGEGAYSPYDFKVNRNSNTSIEGRRPIRDRIDYIRRRKSEKRYILELEKRKREDLKMLIAAGILEGKKPVDEETLEAIRKHPVVVQVTDKVTKTMEFLSTDETLIRIGKTDLGAITKLRNMEREKARKEYGEIGDASVLIQLSRHDVFVGDPGQPENLVRAYLVDTSGGNIIIDPPIKLEKSPYFLPTSPYSVSGAYTGDWKPVQRQSNLTTYTPYPVEVDPEVTELYMVVPVAAFKKTTK